MKGKVNFTKRTLDTLTAPEKGARYIHDTNTRGLAIRITANGIKSFVYYRWIAGKPERITIGRYPDLPIDEARGKAAGYNSAVARGENPAEREKNRRQEWTLLEAFNTYIENHAKHHNKTWQEEIKNFNRYLASWENRKLSSITRSDVGRLHNRLGEQNGKTTANRTIELIRVVYNKAILWEEFKGNNPATDIQKFKLESRDRFLQEHERKSFLQAVKEEDNITVRDFILICLFTGARKSNVLAMKWAQIDFQNHSWRIPETKNGSAHTVPLIPHAMAILNTRVQQKRNDFVFPSDRSGGHIHSPNKVWKRILERAGITDFRIHDLRRTLGSWQAITGASLPIIGKTLAHKSVSTTAIYARLNNQPVEESMNKAMDVLLQDVDYKFWSN